MRKKISRRSFLALLGKTILGLGILAFLPFRFDNRKRFSIKLKSLRIDDLYKKHNLAG